MGKLTLANIRLFNLIKTEVDVKRSEKKDFVSKLKDEFLNSSSIIVAEYSGLTVNESEDLRKEMRSNGAKFKVTKNRLTKLAIAETQFKDISDLLNVQYQSTLLIFKNNKEVYRSIGETTKEEIYKAIKSFS